MNTKEKILLIQLLLEDIRDDWSYKAENRALKAKSLCEEVASETRNEGFAVNEFTILAEFCDTYINTSKRWNDWDGRFFRQTFPMGYERMDKIHGLKPTIKNKSKDFQSAAKEYMINPNARFNDWEEWLNN